MRSFDGQRSDNRPIQRNRAEKEVQLRRLRQEFADLRPTVSATVRDAMAAKILQLEEELSARKERPPRRESPYAGRVRPMAGGQGQGQE